MSKSKTEIIQKFYKDTYLCKSGHTITWDGNANVYSDIACNKCGEKGKNTYPIRWGCSKCNSFYCAGCFNLIPDKICPLKHKYKFYKQNSVDFFTNYTCDICFKKFLTKDGLLFDKDCNLTFCPKCFNDTFDIPDILED